MKNLKFALFASLALALFTGCDEPESAVGIALQGTHKLKDISVLTTTQGSITSGYFILVGSLEGQVLQSTKIRFAWVDNQGLVSISELPVTKLKFHFNPTNTTPTIKFRWHAGSWAQDTQEVMNNNVFFAVIDCKETDFPANAAVKIKQVLENQ